MSRSKPAGTALKILMAAGEVSGDLQGSFLARALLARDEQLRLYGIGGQKMKAAGVDLRIETTHFSSVGFFEAVRFIVPLRKVMQRLQAMIRADRPDAAILIDNHGFNLVLARFLKKEGIPVISYFPPQAWVGSFLFAGGVVRNTQLIVSAFEQEAEVYRRHGGRAVSLGHPLVDIVRPGPDASGVLERLGLDPTRPLMALMPGSRRQEVERLAGPMFGAAERIHGRLPRMQFVLPVASRHLLPLLRVIREQIGFSAEVTFLEDDVYPCLSRCDLVLTTTGTATLETALLGVPMVAAYQLRPLSAWFGWRLSSTRYVAMPNVLLDQPVVPELLQRDVTAERLARASLEILENPARQAAMRAKFREMSAMLGEEGVLDRVAGLVLNEISAPCPSPVAR